MKALRSEILFRKLLILIFLGFNIISYRSCGPACNEHPIWVSCPGVCACTKKIYSINVANRHLPVCNKCKPSLSKTDIKVLVYLQN